MTMDLAHHPQHEEDDQHTTDLPNPKQLNNRRERGKRFNVWSSNSLRRPKARQDARRSEETIVKQPVGRFITNDTNKGIDDGDMVSGVEYSLGKKKRWLIVDEIKKQHLEKNEIDGTVEKAKTRQENSSNGKVKKKQGASGSKKDKTSSNKEPDIIEKKPVALVEEFNHYRRNRRSKNKINDQHSDIYTYADQVFNAQKTEDTSFRSKSKKKGSKKTLNPSETTFNGEFDTHYYEVTWAPKVNDKMWNDLDDHGYWSPEFVFGPPKKNFEQKRRRKTKLLTAVMENDAKGSISSKNRIY